MRTKGAADRPFPVTPAPFPPNTPPKLRYTRLKKPFPNKHPSGYPTINSIHRISSDAVEGNDEVTKYLAGEEPGSIYDIVKFGLTDEEGNFTYIVLKLQSDYVNIIP